MHSDLRSLDLNLLVALDALLRRRSVIAAADELAMSPSALSHALARLRAALDDELFVRIGNAMQPTAHAERLAGPVSAALALLSNGLAQAGRFDPATSDRCFTLAATDYTTFAMLPALVAQVQDLAPRLRFQIVHAQSQDYAEDLASGRLDFALGYVEDMAEPAPGIESFDWLTDHYVVIASRDHPRIRSAPSLDAYMAERHVAVRPWARPAAISTSCWSAADCAATWRCSCPRCWPRPSSWPARC